MGQECFVKLWMDPFNKIPLTVVLHKRHLGDPIEIEKVEDLPQVITSTWVLIIHWINSLNTIQIQVKCKNGTLSHTIKLMRLLHIMIYVMTWEKAKMNVMSRW